MGIERLKEGSKVMTVDRDLRARWENLAASRDHALTQQGGYINSAIGSFAL